MQGLDLGYGYTSDGVNFPLRGHGVGQMPRLGEVFAADLGGTYLINFKSRDAAEGVALAAVPGLRGYDRSGLKSCVLRYVLIGWSGIVPGACHGMILAVPMDYAPFFGVGRIGSPRGCGRRGQR